MHRHAVPGHVTKREPSLFTLTMEFFLLFMVLSQEIPHVCFPSILGADIIDLPVFLVSGQYNSAKINWLPNKSLIE